jgi:hypothetical protein
METKINDVKEFAIGTNIEYDGKLYEVVEQKFCNECSIAHICPTNDVVKHTDYSNLLSRDERVKIFGECSPVKRKDDKSVIFKEISNEDVYDVEVLYKNDKELLPIRINIPSGYTIDIENSDLANNIIKFKSKWLSLKQLYKSAKDNNYHTCLNEIKDSTGDKTCEFREKLVALANLMDIARYFNGNWKYRNRDDNCGYMIAYDKTRTEEDGYQVVHINSDTDMYFGNIMFKNEADAKYVIDNPNFRDILDNIFKV